jgi:hypothetical protein
MRRFLTPLIYRMLTITYPPATPLGMADVLELALRGYLATLVKCLPLAVLAVIAAQLPNIYQLAAGRAPVRSLAAGLQDPVYGGLFVAGIILALLFDGAILVRQHNMLSGRAPGGEAGYVARRLPGIVLFSLVVALMTWGWVELRALMHGPLWQRLLLLPAAYVAAALACTWAMILVRNAPVMHSFARSWQLTRGSILRIMAIYAAALVVFMIFVLLGILAVLACGLIANGSGPAVTAASAVVVVGLGTLAAPFYTAVQLVVLAELSVRRGGAAPAGAGAAA